MNATTMEPVGIQPGTMLSNDEWEGAVTTVASRWNVQPQDALISPYGIQPLPRPRKARADGTGRIPKTCSLPVACHPGWWLPWDVAEARPGEADDRLHLRLYLELVARGFISKEGTVYDPLPEFGVDTSTDAGVALVAAYQGGQPISALATAVLPDADGIDPGWAEREAAVLLPKLRAAWDATAAAHATRAGKLEQQAADLLADPDVDGDLQPLVAAGEALLACTTTEGLRPARAALSAAVDQALGRADAYDQAVATLERAVEARTGRRGPSPAELDARCQARTGARRARADELVAAVYADPAEGTLGPLHGQLHADLVDAVAASRVPLGEWLRVAP